MDPLVVVGAGILGYLVAKKDKNGKQTIVIVPASDKAVIKQRPIRAWTDLGNLDASVVTEYTKVFEATVPSSFEGLLAEVSFYSSRPDITQWMLTIAEEAQFVDKKIYSSLTLPYNGVTLHSGQKVLLAAKTDGVATDIAGSLVGQLQYLG